MATTAEQAKHILDDEALAEEDLLDALESEDIPSNIREERLSQLKKMTQDFHGMKDRQHGEYTEIVDEKLFLEMTLAEDRCVVHFFHADFRRCAIMDGHLSTLAARHFTTKFARISVEKAKFFVSKLKIQVLPAVICFVKGVVTDRIIGFDELGEDGSDDFPTESLERRLSRSGVLLAGSSGAVGGGGKSGSSILGRPSAQKTEDSDSDNDW